MKFDDLKNTYNKIAEDWHEDHQDDTWWQEGTDEFVKQIGSGARVLDVGCAGGVKSKYLISKGMNVLGIDFAEKLIDIAKKEVPEGEFRVLDIHDIDTLEEKFDGIFIQAVLLHIPKKEAPEIIKKAVTKLNPNGHLYIAVKEKIEGGMDEEIKKDNDYGYEYERFFSYFTIEELREYLKDAGLKVIYEDINPPSRTARKSNWVQIIAKK